MVKSVPTQGPADRGLSADEDLRAQVWSLLASLGPRGNVPERRGDRRYPFPYLVQLIPLDEDDQTLLGEPIVVVGKHISERGLGFYHPKPLPHRRMIASLETATGVRVGFLIDLTWCRFTRHGWYESGGRFLQVVRTAT
jgi:hypothetical protein